MPKAPNPVNFVARYHSSDTDEAIIIEDNGQVAYAYWIDEDGEVCADVWLYNRAAASLEPEWDNLEKAPFINPVGFVKSNELFPLPNSAEDVSVDWLSNEKQQEVNIFIYHNLAAKLVKGAKPGWSTLAQKDGPLAKVLR